MDQIIKDRVAASIEHFRLPAYESIPDVGLYLEQTAKYISDYLSPICSVPVTGSMISNYVKKGLIKSPIRKQYSREQIAYLIFIALIKNVLSLDNIARFIQIQKQTYTPQRAYDYFCCEFENILRYVFGLKKTVDQVGVDSTEAKQLLQDAIVALTHKIYQEKCFEIMSEGET